jgi:hypothetical protein
MHRALSLLPRGTQQLRETGENLRLKYRKEVREGGKYAIKRVVFSKELKEWRREAETGEKQKVRTSHLMLHFKNLSSGVSH